ncbi:hypothetical protein ACW9KT_19045 [Hymenobacter sp. HD11105]
MENVLTLQRLPRLWLRRHKKALLGYMTRRTSALANASLLEQG